MAQQSLMRNFNSRISSIPFSHEKAPLNKSCHLSDTLRVELAYSRDSALRGPALSVNPCESWHKCAPNPLRLFRGLVTNLGRQYCLLGGKLNCAGHTTGTPQFSWADNAF
jgi:hypothetical protein